MTDFPAATKMRELANKSHRTKPRRWDIWFFFSKYLGIDVHGKGSVRRDYYEPGSDTPYWKEPDRDDWMKSGDGYLSNDNLTEDKLSLHRATIATEPLDSEGSAQSCVFAFMSHRNRIPELCITVRHHESHIKCYCLWQEEPIFRGTLIQYYNNLNPNLSNKVLEKIREFLLINTPATWFENTKYGDYVKLQEKGESFGFDCGDLVIVEHKASTEQIQGIIVGDPAVMGRESFEPGWKPQIIFLQLVEYDTSDEEKDSPFLPIDILEDKKVTRQSIDIVGFRFAPYDVAHIRADATLANKDKVLKEIKRRLGALL